MSRRDAMHEACKNALVKAGWTITHDPYMLRRGRQNLFIDLGAELPLAAEKEGRKIAVEVKSLVGSREMAEFERALGQYILYRSLMRRVDPHRTLFLALLKPAYEEHFDTVEGLALIAEEKLKLIVFERKTEEIAQWIE
jgi:hypothetical protein